MRLCDHVIDLSALHAVGLLDGLGLSADVLSAPILNPLMKLGKSTTVALRESVQALMTADCPDLRDQTDAHVSCLVPVATVTMHMPVEVGDYTEEELQARFDALDEDKSGKVDSTLPLATRTLARS